MRLRWWNRCQDECQFMIQKIGMLDEFTAGPEPRWFRCERTKGHSKQPFGTLHANGGEMRWMDATPRTLEGRVS